MLQSIEAGKINLVITKDLSRLGRDYIDTGYYLERYFPLKNVRYIAINDGIDTFAQSGGNDISPFKAVMNDMYAKDISKKVRTALHTKKLKGHFIGSIAPYGYKKDPENKGRLIIDEQTAPVVRLIFSMFLAGESKLGIANKLSLQGISTPSQAKNLKSTQIRHKGVWNEVTIGRILTNPTYAGDLTQNRARKLNYKLNTKVNLPSMDWIIVENTHQPIISRTDFDMVSQIIKKRAYVKSNTGEPHLLSGLVRCGDCGGTMTFVKESPKRTYLVCAFWKKHAKLNLCSSHSIREDYLEQQLVNTLRQLSKEYLNRSKILEETQKTFKPNDIMPLEQQIEALKSEMEHIKFIMSNLYKDKARGIIPEGDFLEMLKQFTHERDAIRQRIDTIQEQASVYDSCDNINSLSYLDCELENFLTFEHVDRQMLVMLIDKIEVYKNKRIKFNFNFRLLQTQQKPS